MKLKFRNLALFGALVLAGCGGGGGDGGTVQDDGRNLPEARPTAAVSGVAFDGLIIDGDVRVYDFTGASRGVLLGTGKTNGQGLYSVQLSTSDKPVLVEIDGGYYIEEDTGVQVQVDKTKGRKMVAVEYYESGKPVQLAATFFSSVATGLVECMVKDQGLSTEVAIERAYAQVDDWAGFDTRRTIPVDVSASANSTPYLTDAHRYGFVAAGISALSRQVGAATGDGVHDVFTSISFIQMSQDDARTGCKLDGTGSNGRINFGNLAVSANTYRDLLAMRMLQFVRGDRNMTDLEFADVLPFASRINTYAGELFDNQPAPDITESQPIITQLTPGNGTVMSGTYPVSILVNEPYGVQSIHVYIGDRFVVAASLSDGRADIDTRNFTNGSYVMSVVVTNFMGNSATATRNIRINNGQLSLVGSGASTTGWTDASTVGCVGSLTLEDTTNSGIKYAKVDDAVVLLDVSGPAAVQWGATFDGKEVCAVRTVTAADNLGNVYSFPARIRVEVADTRVAGGRFNIQYRFTCRWDVASNC